MRIASLLSVLLLVSAACGDDDRPGDTGSRDTGFRDTGSTDTGVIDSGPRDASSDGSFEDSSAVDSGRVDSGGTDTGAGDSGGEDGGTDAGRVDAGTDAGGEDAGAPGCTMNGECGRAQYCAGERCDGPGICSRRPEACPDIYRPVCGCDGVTYGNSCEAAGSGARVASDGECAVSECGLRPPRSCCYDSGDCAGLRCTSDRCEVGAAGVCVGAPPPGQCWVDADCPGSTCEGEIICPCGAACLVPDRPGCCGGLCS